ncbi:MAG: hypothetical protein D6784_00670 [Chloroflexi bacterium]|nr:MAG: hypothetical protein D6784_00670 [Chloroflexota bacterium]
MKLESLAVRAVLSLAVLVGLLNLPAPAMSQDNNPVQNVLVNGDFEAGFQEAYQLALGWGGFSNGNAVVGFQDDTWEAVVVSGEHAQMIEIRDSMELNRYAGIYQTVNVTPGVPYTLTLHGLIRSTEGDINLSDYGYRLQYAVDYSGGTAWELLDEEAWVELPWDEQPLADPPGGEYRLDTYQTTITPTGKNLTLFIRAWKKWANNGTGIFDLDSISLVGPAPSPFDISAAEAAVVTSAPAENAPASAPPAAPAEDEAAETPADQSLSTSVGPATAPPVEDTRLPVSGRGANEHVSYLIASSILLLLALFVGAVTATMRERVSADAPDINLGDGGI